eukprot:scaffold14305_cov33-Tisochrysis_lutea.AAC.2
MRWGFGEGELTRDEGDVGGIRISDRLLVASSLLSISSRSPIPAKLRSRAIFCGPHTKQFVA